MDLPPATTNTPPDEPLSQLLKRLGLPPDYNHKRHAHYIPTHSDLQRAAVYALDEWTAFLVLHHDTPAVIADRLTELADIVKAICAIDGDHRARAVRLGLELDHHYWWSQNKADEMPGLILFMLSTALDIGDQRLLSRVYRMWSVYLYLAQDQPKSKKALDMALEYADDSGREDLALLARIERFNLEAALIELDEAEIRANELLVEARRLHYTYAQGRIYLSLARAYHRATVSHMTFMYAQQALTIFVQESQPDLAGQAVDEMLGSLQQQRGSSPVFTSNLLAYLEHLLEACVNPWFQASTYYHQAVQSHIQKDYDRARAYVLKAWMHYRIIRQPESCISAVHMLGLIQTKRQRWNIAARHLKTAADFYQKMNNAVMSVHIHHALAYIPFEQGDFRRAVDQLETVLVQAEALPEEAARERLVGLICGDMEEARTLM
jgi:tetratricopeptide (TPR) repeat protein